MKFPEVRMQRLKKNDNFRSLFAEVRLDSNDFVAPLFVKEGINQPEAISTMPDIFRHSLHSILDEVGEIAASGITAILLFGIPKNKDNEGSASYDSEGIIQKAIRLIKRDFPAMTIIADCCLCDYTTHGHCGIMEQGCLKNDQTLKILQKIALSYAEAGVDIIAPSGSMDGMVGAIRKALDERGYDLLPIMSYAIKYASCFYGPFREAGGIGILNGNRRHHQMQPSQRREAVREVQLDIAEGADIVMVKPGMPYLDIIRDIREQFSLPIATYQVSGEYAMLKVGAKAQLFDELSAFHESFIGYKRAGADIIISYYAKEMANFLNKNK